MKKNLKYFENFMKTNKPLNKGNIKTLCQIWMEMNAIKAADGAPRGVSSEYWQQLMDQLKIIIVSDSGFEPINNPSLEAE